MQTRDEQERLTGLVTDEPAPAQIDFDGSIKHVQVVADGVQKDGRLVEVSSTARDIPEQKRAEEVIRRSEAYLADAQKLSDTGSWGWNPVSNAIVYWSEECYRILGYDPAEGLPSFESSFQRIYPEDRPLLAETIERAVREKAEFETEYRRLH